VGVASTVSASVRLAAPADEVWAWATTPDGVNDELRPLLLMTVPSGWQAASLAELEAPVHVGRSWILALGFLPFDYDDLHLVEVGERSFSERSTMLSATYWHHDRRVEDDGEGCVVHDRLGFELRRPLRWIPGSGRLHRAVITRVFAHRHAQLVARFGPG
jgi:ligand-binding SRPBCC domain-containing protein